LASVQFYSPDNEWSAISRLRKDECDEGAMYPTDDGTLRDVWCGDNSKVNEYPESKNEYIDNLAEDLSRLNVKETNLSHGKQGESLSGDNLASNNKREGVYTFGDAFCGAGGVSRGAAMANLQVQWGFGSSLNAYEAYKANFPHAALLLTAANFIGHQSVKYKVDVLHLSPPCQAFSTANTRPNPEKNSVNIAASMMIGGILSIARPRAVTLEQTPGIIHSKYQRYCDEVLRQFTRLGYSIRWKIMRFVEYGLPQERERLIIIASGYVTILDCFFWSKTHLKARRSPPDFSYPHSWHQARTQAPDHHQRHDRQHTSRSCQQYPIENFKPSKTLRWRQATKAYNRDQGQSMVL